MEGEFPRMGRNLCGVALQGPCRANGGGENLGMPHR